MSHMRVSTSCFWGQFGSSAGFFCHGHRARTWPSPAGVSSLACWVPNSNPQEKEPTISDISIKIWGWAKVIDPPQKMVTIWNSLSPFRLSTVSVPANNRGPGTASKALLRHVTFGDVFGLLPWPIDAYNRCNWTQVCCFFPFLKLYVHVWSCMYTYIYVCLYVYIFICVYLHM